MKNWRFLLYFFYIKLALTIFQEKSKTKPIITQLRARWNHTPLILEAAEFLNDESPVTFWSFLEDISKSEKNFRNEYEEYMFFLDKASKFLSPQQLNLLKWSLSLRMYSPKIEMFYQMALDLRIHNLNCDNVANVQGNLTCDFKQIEHLIKAAEDIKPLAFDIDHSYPKSSNNKVAIILYGDINSLQFKLFHENIKKYVEIGTVHYIFRPYIKDRSQKRINLSGFGVELQIKSTEYKSQDDTKIQEEKDNNEEKEEGEDEVEGFIFKKLKYLYPDHLEDLNDFKQQLVESTHEMAPMKVWQMQHLSMQAAQRIVTAPLDEKLNLMVQTAQNFPMLARSLIRTKVDDKLKKEVLKNQNMLKSQMDIRPLDAYLFINGVQFDMEYTDIFTLFDYIRTEQKVIEGFYRLGITNADSKKLLHLDLSEKKQEYGIDIRESSIRWVNNLETGKLYRRWPSSVTELLRPSYPGMLQSIRKNIHNLVLILDPASSLTLSLLQYIESFIANMAPIHIGLILAPSPLFNLRGYDDVGVAVLCAFNYISQNMDGSEEANLKALAFLIELYMTKEGGTLTVEDITRFFSNRYTSVDLDEVFDEDSDYDVGRQLASEFIAKGGFQKLPQALMNGVPLPEKYVNGEEFEEIILMEVMRNTQYIQKSVFKGELTDSENVIDWLMSQSNIMPRLNDKILSVKSSSYIDMSGEVKISDINDVNVKTLEHSNFLEITALVASTCSYISNKDNNLVKPLTIWVVGDYETDFGRQLLLEALHYLRESNSVRICIIHNKENDSGDLFVKLIEASLAAVKYPHVRQFLLKILDGKNAVKLKSGEKTIQDLYTSDINSAEFENYLANFNSKKILIHSEFCSKVLGIGLGKSTIIANGRMIGTLEKEQFTSEDFSLLEKHMSALMEKVISSLTGNENSSDMIMRASSVVQMKSSSKSRVTVPLSGEHFSVVKLPPREADLPAFDIVAVCDPASAGAQLIGPVIQILYDVVNANVKVILNAIEKHSEMPLKRFYRQALHSHPLFNKDGELLSGPVIKFIGLPERTIFTLNYKVPDNWLVEVVQSLYDLDNIKLELVESGVYSEFELEHLLLEGHCFEQTTGNPPRGLQFTLGTKHEPVKVDTIVMANLGYFQMKANPGVWLLRLREGSSSDIYSITNHEGTDTPAGLDDVQVIISSFRSHVVKIRVSKNTGKQDVDLLEEDNNSGGLWSSLTSTFTSGRKKEEEDETVNIFSLASGHLYERFLRIMIVSVCKHTQYPIKFWLIKNFLSPTLKDSLPSLANEYGFQYELVQYKWPRWLHQQTEKQRIIWGYKILFLDVLFPLNVKKVIFVDADQVVRADIKELYDLDLDGAPYGFVPFCDSRKEMEGFRFWKQGYWRNHLAGRKYHISALFVVDLKKFRKLAAGDRLRGQYQGLSQDPNSLSNLDQDLPNNMIHQVRIKSLPMEWLWCETWCDDNSKSYAKVIDVCNNPMTKEAKLEAAQRIITEWTDYDGEIKSVLQNIKINNAKSSHSLHTEL